MTETVETIERIVREDRSTISYGPWSEDPERWSLSASTTSGDRVRLLLERRAMYDLWREVHNVPWSRDEHTHRTVGREIVEKIQDLNEDQLRDILDYVDHVGGRKL